MPYIIKKEQIAEVLTMADVIKIMEQTFRLHGLGKIQQPAKTYLTLAHRGYVRGDLRSMPGYIGEFCY